MADPVLCADGHSYERAAIMVWFDQKRTLPATGERLQSRDLIPNRALRNLIQDTVGAR